MRLLILSLFIFSCQKNAIQSLKTANPNPIIYGEDNRFDYNQVSDPDLQEMARSTVALISNEHLVYDSIFDNFHLEKPDINLPMCPSEKFRRQPQWAHCSGSLIGADLILTAGHCVPDGKACKNTKFIFDYTFLNAQTSLVDLPAKNIFSCAGIIFTTNQKNEADFAIIRLDRQVVGRTVLKFSEQEITYNDPLMLIGHPAGYPTKLTLNGKVRSLLPEAFFVASVDAFAGNSGSSVFDQNTRRIVGVLARGENDYEKTDGCYKAKVCRDDDCRGEDVTRISEIKKYLPQN